LTYVFDACALIALLNREKEFGRVKDLLDRAIRGEFDISMSIVNLTEVYYGYIRDKGMEEADRIMLPVASFPIRVITTITDEVYREAARVKGLYSIALGDAFLCGTAKSLGATIVTKDGEIRKPEQPEALSVLWINDNLSSTV
jgi:predicted nucleic acid-binding protein